MAQSFNFSREIWGIAAVAFYILCWLNGEENNIIWYLGIALPWLSLIVSVPVMFIAGTKNHKEGKVMAITYALFTAAYVLTVSFMRHSIVSQLPHAACCVCLIVYFVVSRKN